MKISNIFKCLIKPFASLFFILICLGSCTENNSTSETDKDSQKRINIPFENKVTPVKITTTGGVTDRNIFHLFDSDLTTGVAIESSIEYKLTLNREENLKFVKIYGSGDYRLTLSVDDKPIKVIDLSGAKDGWNRYDLPEVEAEVVFLKMEKISDMESLSTSESESGAESESTSGDVSLSGSEPESGSLSSPESVSEVASATGVSSLSGSVSGGGSNSSSASGSVMESAHELNDGLELISTAGGESFSATKSIKEMEIWCVSPLDDGTSDEVKSADDNSIAHINLAGYNLNSVKILSTELKVSSEEGSSARTDINFNLEIDPQLYDRAIIKYKARGAHSFWNFHRKYNGGDEIGGVWFDFSGYSADKWYDISEEINIDWLNGGANCISFKLDKDFSIKDMEIFLFQKSGAIPLRDIESIKNGIELNRDREYFQIDFQEKSNPHSIYIYMDKSYDKDSIKYQYMGESGLVDLDVNLSNDKYSAGWNRVDLNDSISTDLIRLSLNMSDSLSNSSDSSSSTLDNIPLNININNISVIGSPVIYGKPAEMVISYPLDGQFFGDVGVISGFIKNLKSSNDPSSSGFSLGSTFENIKNLSSDGAFLIKENLNVEQSTDGESTNNGADSKSNFSLESLVKFRDMNNYQIYQIENILYTDNLNKDDDSLSNGTTESSNGDSSNSNSDSETDSETDSGSESGSNPDNQYKTMVYPQMNQSITFRGVTLDIPAGTVKEATEFTIIELASDQIDNLNAGMTNVTSPAAGYRFLPSGVFDDHITVRFKYDPTSLSSGMKDEDVYMYYFHEKESRWKRLSRVGVDKAGCEIVSKTNHFTDIINATIKVPDNPEALSYDPNSIKNISGATADSRINLMELGPAGNSGDLSGNYPIEIPAGRKGLQPSVSINYNSGGGYGRLGQGFSIATDSITIDTRWGVPRYDGKEVFLLNGARLVKYGSDSVGDLYRPEVEKGFKRIRKIFESGKYYWEVTDKTGVKYIYGQSHNSKFVSNREIKGKYPVCTWYLEKVVDLNGNNIIYQYESDSVNGLVVAKYLSNIYYTGVNNSKGVYSVEFINDNGLNKKGVSFSYRTGFKVMHRRLLSKINVKFKDSVIRSYEFNYMDGRLNKTLLKSITQKGLNGATFDGNVHEFNYFDEMSEGYKYSEEHTISGSRAKGISLFGKDFNAGAISATQGSGTSVNLYIGFSPLSYSKSRSAGVSLGQTFSSSNTTLQLIDINGDGLPDQVYVDGGVKCRLAEMSGDGVRFGNEQMVYNFPVSSLGSNTSSRTTTGGQVHALVVSSSYDKINGSSRTSKYFSDVNGDGLVDFVSGRNVFFNISTGGRVEFSQLATDPAFIGGANIDGATFTYSAREDMLDTKYLDDPMRMWKAPYDGRIKINSIVKIPDDVVELNNGYDANKKDGVIATILIYESAKNKYRTLWSDSLNSSDNRESATIETLNVRGGDYICFRLNSMYDGFNDVVEWSPEVDYVEYHKYKVHPYSGEEYLFQQIAIVDMFDDSDYEDNPFDVDGNLLDENGLKIFNYDAEADFSSAGADFVNSVKYDCRDGGSLIVKGKFSKSKITSDDVRVVVEVTESQFNNDSGQMENVTVDSHEIFYSHDDMVEDESFSFNLGELSTSNGVRVSIESDSPIDLSACDLISTMEYSYYRRDRDGTKLDMAEAVENALVSQTVYRAISKTLTDEGDGANNVHYTGDFNSWEKSSQIENPFVFHMTDDEEDDENTGETVSRTVRFGVSLEKIYGGYGNEHHWKYCKMRDMEYTTSSGEVANLYNSLGVKLIIKKWDEESNTSVVVDSISGEIENREFDFVKGDLGSGAEEYYQEDARVIFEKDVDFAEGSKYYFIYMLDKPEISKYVEYIQPQFVNQDSTGNYLSLDYENTPTEYIPIEGGVKIYKKEENKSAGGGYRNWYYGRAKGDRKENYSGDNDVTGYREFNTIEDTPLIEEEALNNLTNTEDQESAENQTEKIEKYSSMAYSADLATKMKETKRSTLTEEELEAKYGHMHFKAWTGMGTDCWISGTRMSATRIIDHHVAKTEEAIRAAYIGEDELPTEVGLCSRGVIKNSSSSSKAYGGSGGYGGINAGGTLSRGTGKCEKDFFDFNGDGYPDVITRGHVQFTNYLGELDENRTAVAGFDYIKENENENMNFSTSISGIGGAADTEYSGSGEAKGTVGLAPGANMGSGTNRVSADFIDINGDGLPDRVYSSGGKVKVRYNRGYGLTDEEILNSGTDKVGYSKTGSYATSLAANHDKGAYGGGVSISHSEATDGVTYIDVNGDGLKDRVVSDITYSLDSGLTTDGDFVVYFNEGGGFSNSGVTFNNSYGTVGSNSTTSGGVSAYVTAPIPVCVPFFIGSFLINPGFGHTTDYGGAKTTLMDMNGDGFPDMVKSTDGKLKVRYNLTGKTNLLKGVARPLGSTVSVDYSREGNTTKMSRTKWTVKEITIDDGSNKTSEGHILKSEYKFSGGVYDRKNRCFTGFENVISRNSDGLYGVTEYHTDYFKQGLVVESFTKVMDGILDFDDVNHLNDILSTSSGRIYSKTTYEYNQIVLNANNRTRFTSLIKKINKVYEGNLSQSITKKEEFTYDDWGNVKTFIDHGDVTTSADDVKAVISYDKPGGLRENYLPGLASAIYVYDGIENGKLLRRRYADYDSRGNQTAITLYNGLKTIKSRYYYNSYGNVKFYSGPEDKYGYMYMKYYTYDDVTNSFITEIRDNNAYKSRAVYDYKWGLPLKTFDMNNNVIKYYYDVHGRVDSVYGPKDQYSSVATVDFIYDTDIYPARVICRNKESDDSVRTIDIISYMDGLKRVVQSRKTSEVAGQVTMVASGKIAFDSLGRVKMQGQPSTVSTGYNYSEIEMKNPTTFYYDEVGRQKRIVYPDNNEVVLDYSIESNLHRTRTKDQLGNFKAVFKNVRGLIKKVREFDGSSDIDTLYDYNCLNQITKVTDADNNETTVTYDLLGRRTGIDNPDTGLTEFVYDDTGKLVRKITPNSIKDGKFIQYYYHKNRLQRIYYPEGNNVIYTYGAPDAPFNRAGRISKVQNDDCIIEYSYGKMGEVIEEKKSIKQTVPTIKWKTHSTKYQFDNLGRMESMEYADGEVVRYFYNHGGLLNSVKGFKDGKTHSYVKDIIYDEFGQRTKLSLGNGVVNEYTYDMNTRRLSHLKSYKGSNVFQNISYKFDAVGNILERVNKDFVTSGSVKKTSKQTYEYDNLYRLTSSEGEYTKESWLPYFNDRTNIYTSSTSYNRVGNITHKMVDNRGIYPELGNDMRTLKDTSYDREYTYGGAQPHAVTKAGDLVMGYDANGNMTTKEWTKYGVKMSMTWNSENRMTESISQNVYSGAKTLTRYKYDHEGNRVVKSSNYGEVVTPSAEISYRNDSIVTKHIFVSGVRVASKVCDDKSSNTYYQSVDHLGSTNVLTDDKGEFYEHIETFPDGSIWVKEYVDQSGVNATYTNYEMDVETKLFYAWARYYDAQLGKFISVDPIIGSYLDGKRGMGGVYNSINNNLYHYAGNNPVKYIDPDGLSTWKKVLGFKNWWFRFDQSSGKGDPAHYHFGKGKDPNSSKFVQLKRRVVVGADGEYKQYRHGGNGGSSGSDSNVPKDVIENVVNTNAKDNQNLKSVKVEDTWFGYGNEEKFEERSLSTREIVKMEHGIKDIEKYSDIDVIIYRNKETGERRAEWNGGAHYKPEYRQSGSFPYMVTPTGVYPLVVPTGVPVIVPSPVMAPTLTPVFVP